MFAYSSDTSVIPSLSFSKAELLYATLFLLKDISNSDTSTQIEMVEMRHYLNQIKDKVLLAAYNGSLNDIGIETPREPTKATEAKKTAIPPMSELKARFPTLSEDEIREIFEKAQKDRDKEEAKKMAEKKPEPHPPPSFVITDSNRNGFSSPPNPKDNPTKPDGKQNSQKFASMLGL